LDGLITLFEKPTSTESDELAGQTIHAMSIVTEGYPVLVKDSETRVRKVNLSIIGRVKPQSKKPKDDIMVKHIRSGQVYTIGV
jgi:hypothetical protein